MFDAASSGLLKRRAERGMLLMAGARPATTNHDGLVVGSDTPGGCHAPHGNLLGAPRWYIQVNGIPDGCHAPHGSRESFSTCASPCRLVLYPQGGFREEMWGLQPGETPPRAPQGAPPIIHSAPAPTGPLSLPELVPWICIRLACSCFPSKDADPCGLRAYGTIHSNSS